MDAFINIEFVSYFSFQSVVIRLLDEYDIFTADGSTIRLSLANNEWKYYPIPLSAQDFFNNQVVFDECGSGVIFAYKDTSVTLIQNTPNQLGIAPRSRRMQNEHVFDFNYYADFVQSVLSTFDFRYLKITMEQQNI